MKKYTGIYMITNIKTDEAYIGASTDVKKRWSNHLAHSRTGTHTYACFNDIDSVKFEILEECSVGELQAREDYWMKYMSELFTVVNKSKAGKTPFNSDEGKYIKSKCQQGSLNGHARLSEKDAIKIKVLLRDTDITCTKLAEWFGVSAGHISLIKKGIKWPSVNIDGITMDDISVPEELLEKTI